MSALTLASLAGEIAREHHAAQAAASAALGHAHRCGELLTEAKSKVGHGSWGAWLSEHFPGSARTAELRLRPAEWWEALQKGSERRKAELQAAGVQ